MLRGILSYEWSDEIARAKCRPMWHRVLGVVIRPRLRLPEADNMSCIEEDELAGCAL